MGNHDYDNINKNIPYLNYFTLPGNEVFYDFIWGPVHFYALNSNSNLATQRIWFRDKLFKSEQPFNVVYFHHPPYSSGYHGNDKNMQWDFEGVDFVLTGHDYTYERNIKLNNPLPAYIVSGLEGKKRGGCNQNPLDADLFDSFCYDNNYGTLFIDATASEMNIKFISLEDKIIDSYTIKK